MDSDTDRCNCNGCRDCDGLEVGCNCEVIMELEKEAIEAMDKPPGIQYTGLAP